MCTKERLDEIVYAYATRLRALFRDSLREVILFGSYARGDAGQDSDVDLLVLVDLPRDAIIPYRSAVADITSDFLFSDEVFISPVIENRDFYRAHIDILPFYRNIEREGVRIGA